MVNVSTSTYTTRGKNPLKLDIYDDDHYAEVASRGVVISIHNGNFLGGNRSAWSSVLTPSSAPS